MSARSEHDVPAGGDALSEVMELQMGPSHPATHGTIKFNLRLHGETILSCDTEVGYLHRGFEKMCEQGTWTQCIPYTDRLNFASPLINFIFCEAVERMLGVTVPERCSYIRVILSELSRLTDHLTCLGMGATELGAFTVGFQAGCDLVFKGEAQPSGYPEPLLHAWRLKVKAAARS